MQRCAPPWCLPIAGAAIGLAGLAGCRNNAAGGHPFDAGQDKPTGADQATVIDADCPADAQGGGVCPINFCGFLKSVATLGISETAQAGADGLCNRGRICVATAVTAAGDAVALTCVSPNAAGLDYGMPCAAGAASATPCKDDSLCTTPASGGAPFCSTLCRLDADCPVDSFCLEYQVPLPNQSHALVGKCTPRARIAGTPCAAERDCPAGQGCVRAGDRTALLICKAGGAKALGAACAAAAECRSGECLDRDFNPPVNPPFGNRTYCSGVCAKNSDCGADQRCVDNVLSNNGTLDDPRDDVVVGYCRTLFAPTAAGACAGNQACVDNGRGGDTCDAAHGLCYKSTAAIGGACANDDACGLGAACVTGPTFAGGACLMEGCVPGAAAGVDLCPGSGAVCSQRASDEPLHRCYEGCTMDAGCTRAAQSYFCAAAKTGQPVTICLSR
jgi:hypothetical protein